MLMDELIDLYDENGSHIGTELRSIVHANGLWHKTAQVWLLNEKNELLLQFRSADKDCFPSLWDISSAGHIPAGCAVKESAIRELEEELGLKASQESLIHLFQHVDPYEDIRTGHIDKEFSEVFLLKVDSHVDFTLQIEEVEKVKWIHYKMLIPEYEQNSADFVPHSSHFKKLVDAIDKLLGL